MEETEGLSLYFPMIRYSDFTRILYLDKALVIGHRSWHNIRLSSPYRTFSNHNIYRERKK